MSTTHTATRPRRWPWVAGIVVALLSGVGIGSAGGGEDAAKMSGPQPTVTVTAEPVVETETVTEVPDVCLDAIIGLNDTLGHYHQDMSDVLLVAFTDEGLEMYEKATARMIDDAPFTEMSACFAESDRSGDYYQMLDVWEWE